MSNFMDEFNAWLNGKEVALNAELPKIEQAAQTLTDGALSLQPTVAETTTDVDKVVADVETTVAPDVEKLMSFFHERVTALETAMGKILPKLFPHDYPQA